MNRLAIFVEGMTEQIFIERVTRECCGNKGLLIEKTKARGGVSTKKRTTFVKAALPSAGIEYYVLIVDCGSDGSVKSRILEEYRNLANKGYQRLIALRDAPKKRDKIQELRTKWPTGVPNGPLPCVLVLAIMEIEAWFLSEHTHLQKIDPSLTCELILEKLGFDPRLPNLQSRDRPAKDLDEAYGLVDESYKKGQAATRTIYSLDMDRIFVEMAEHEPEIQRLFESINEFLEQPI